MSPMNNLIYYIGYILIFIFSESIKLCLIGSINFSFEP